MRAVVAAALVRVGPAESKRMELELTNHREVVDLALELRGAWLTVERAEVREQEALVEYNRLREENRLAHDRFYELRQKLVAAVTGR
jgi:hypothetical protein